MQRHVHRERRPAKAPAAGPKPVLEMVQLAIFRVCYRRLEDRDAGVKRVYRLPACSLLDAQTWAEVMHAIVGEMRAVQAELWTAANKAGKKKR